MNRFAIPALVMSLFLVNAACSGTDRKETAAAAKTDATAAELTPEQLAEVGARIQKDPSHAKDVLREHGMTEESFEKAIRKVTENVDESKRYAAAYKKASV